MGKRQDRLSLGGSDLAGLVASALWQPVIGSSRPEADVRDGRLERRQDAHKMFGVGGARRNMRRGTIIVVLLFALFGLVGFFFLRGSVAANPIFDALISRPHGVPVGARTYWDIKGGFSWNVCRPVRSGSDHARWFGNGGLDAVWVTPGAPCPGADLAVGLMIESPDTDHADLVLVGGDDRQTCGERLRKFPQSRAFETAALADKQAFGAEAKRAFEELARTSATGLVLLGQRDGVYTWCTLKAGRR